MDAPAPINPPAAAPVMFDYELPDALLRAREAALLVVRPCVRAHGFSEPRFRLLRALALAGEPLAQSEAALRAGLGLSNVRLYGAGLAEAGHVEWVRREGAKTDRHALLEARDIGRRRVGHVLRDALARAEAAGAPTAWRALEMLPENVRFDSRMRAELGALMQHLRNVCAREALTAGGNAPDPDGDDLLFGLALRTQRTRIALVARIAGVLRAFDLNEAQWRILRMVAAQPGVGLSVKALIRRGCFNFGANVVTRSLFYLSQRGLVRRAHWGAPPAPWRTDWHGPPKNWRADIAPDGLFLMGLVERRMRAEAADLFARMGGVEAQRLDMLLRRLTNAILWRDGLAAEDQETHPRGAQYDRFDAYVWNAARDAGAKRTKRPTVHWWE